ncbi:MAG: aminoglycoside phosphotransferase family protein [Clostridia bacterium]|nr:aminoglycoside phosphotransferase family protein [Clostridia bacterium]
MNDQKLQEIFETLIEKFHLKGKLSGYKTIKTGNINDTYIIHTVTEDGEERDYTVQRINHYVFRNPEQVANNAYSVTEHIEKKLRAMGQKDIRRRVVRIYRMDNGRFFYQSADRNFWRVLSYVYNSTNVSTANDLVLYGTGIAFGEFQRYLADFHAESLFTTIPDFHNTPKRFRDLRASAMKDLCGRAGEVQDELEYLYSMEEYVSLLDRLHKQGKLPKRVVHNDTKCNNVMFDEETLTPLAVIDLDTVMPGYVAHDFGDAVRFACNTADEDEKDLSKVSLCLKSYMHFASGFVDQLWGIITETELETLPDGVLIITLELAARFLKDYLDGDLYFKCREPKHNLSRTRCQIALAKDIFQKLPEMRRLLNEITVQK